MSGVQAPGEDPELRRNLTLMLVVLGVELVLVMVLELMLALHLASAR